MAVRDPHPKPPVLDPFYFLIEVSAIQDAAASEHHCLHVDKVARAKLMKKPPRSVARDWELITESLSRCYSAFVDDFSVTICNVVHRIFAQNFELAREFHRHPHVVCVAECQVFALSRSYSVVPRPGRA